MSEIPADIWLISPGSKSGTSVPGIFGPPGKSPTHRSAPASRPRYQVSPRDTSETPGASALGAPNRTRPRITASATAHTARLAARAKAPSGCVLKAPKKVITFTANVARIGTPRSARAAMTSSQPRLGMRGARPPSRAMLRVWARSERVTHAPAISAAASPPANSPSTLPAMPRGDTAAMPMTVTPPGTIARYAPACRMSSVRGEQRRQQVRGDGLGADDRAQDEERAEPRGRGGDDDDHSRWRLGEHVARPTVQRKKR